MGEIELQLREENEALRLGLQEARETLTAIQSGEVDALVIDGPAGEQVYSLRGVDHSYRVLIEEMHEGALTLAEEGIVLYANRFVEKMIEAPLESIIGSAFRQYVDSYDLPVLDAFFRSDTKNHLSTELKLIKNNGTKVPALFSANRICLEDVSVICVAVADLSEQKRRESIMAQELLNRSIIEQSADAIIVCDDQGIVIRASKAAHNMAGQNCLNKKFCDLFNIQIKSNPANLTSDTAYDDNFNLDRVIEGRKYLTCEAVLSGNEAVFIHLLLSATPLTDDNAKTIGAIVNFTDVTERKKLESQLTQAQKMESVGRLAGGIAHDFNNMLSIINGYAELALEKINPYDPIYDDIVEIQKAGQRSRDLTRQLLAFARKQVAAPKEIDLNRLIEKCDKMLQRLIGEDISVKIVLSPNLWPVKIDPSQVDQILVNLAVNSRDAISGVGDIIIETANITLDQDDCSENPGLVPGRYILLAFSDSGCGMSKETQAQIFEPFYTTKAKFEGTGLGLSTVYGIVKQNDGFIIVYTEQGQGTTFKIYLPRHEGLVEKWSESTKPSSLKGSETILIVEDEKQILKICRKTLENKGYNVLTAGAPGEAIILCEKTVGKIDLLITDIVMPTMNGNELMNRLKDMKPDLRVLFMSGYTDNIILNRGMIKKGMNFLQKPFSPKELSQKVRKIIDDTQGINSSTSEDIED